MARPPRTDQARKRAGRLVIYISIKRVKPGQEPPASGKTSKQRSERSASSKGRKKQEMAKYRRTNRSRGRRSGTPRGVRRQRRRRVSFSAGNKPLPAFFLFMEEHYRDLQKSNPHLSGAEMAVKLGKMWHEQPEKDKDVYKKKAAQLRRYRRRR